jgi:hypothetical protein
LTFEVKIFIANITIRTIEPGNRGNNTVRWNSLQCDGSQSCKASINSTW